MIKIGDIVTAKCNLGYIITGMVTVIDNAPYSGVPSVLVRTKYDEELWCYLSDNPELEVPRVFEKNARTGGRIMNNKVLCLIALVALVVCCLTIFCSCEEPIEQNRESQVQDNRFVLLWRQDCAGDAFKVYVDKKQEYNT